MKNFCVLFIIFNINLVYSGRTPAISYITPTTIKDIGGIADLICTILYASEFPVVWMKVDKENKTDAVVIATKNTLIIRDPRFSLRENGDNSFTTTILQIRDIQETNIGIYRCQVQIRPSDKIFAEVALIVRQPPTISDNSTRSLIVFEGKSVKIECYASGYPLPKIWWRRANNAILSGGRSMYKGNVLEISNITKEDRGTYYCCAENGVRRGARRHITLEVEFAPVVTVLKTYLVQALRYDVDLECHIEAYPPPAIIWLKDGNNLTNSQHYSISQFATEDEVTDTTLRVLTIEKRQYGNYTCKAKNFLGTAEATIQIDETVTPVCPPACELPSRTKSISIKYNTISPSCFIFVFIFLIRPYF